MCTKAHLQMTLKDPKRVWDGAAGGGVCVGTRYIYIGRPVHIAGIFNTGVHFQANPPDDLGM